MNRSSHFGKVPYLVLHIDQGHNFGLMMRTYIAHKRMGAIEDLEQSKSSTTLFSIDEIGTVRSPDYFFKVLEELFTGQGAERVRYGNTE